LQFCLAAVRRSGGPRGGARPCHGDRLGGGRSRVL